MRRTIFFWLVLLTISSTLPAADKVPRGANNTPDASGAEGDFSYSPNWPEPPDTSGMLLRLGFGTVVTLGLCAATLIFGRRWLQRPAANTTSRKLQIEESIVLGHRATLFLVKVGDSHLVAGTDASGLKSLIVLPAAFHEVLDQQLEGTELVPAKSGAASAAADWKTSSARAA